MFTWRPAKLFVSLAMVVIAHAELARGEDNPPLTLRNDISAPIDLYVASEKSQSNSPWHHITLDEGQSTKVTLSAPDRYFIVLQIGGERSRSKPLDLKQFAAAHPNYVMTVSEIQDNTLGGPMGGGGESRTPNVNHIGAAVQPDANAQNAASATNTDTLPVQFERFGADDPSIWALSADNVALKLHNDLDDAVDVYIASKKNENPNPWTHLHIEASGDEAIVLKSPDPFLIRIDMRDESARSKPVELKKFLAEHRDYVMNVGRSYENMIAGASEGSGGGGSSNEPPPKLRAHVDPDPNARNNQQQNGANSTQRSYLDIDWER